MLLNDNPQKYHYTRDMIQTSHTERENNHDKNSY